jgi:hypothetical protein
MKTVIEMAREAAPNCHNEGLVCFDHFELERFAELVRADEREACAKVCDDFERAKWESVKNITQNGGRLAFAGPMHCAAAIRARSST